MVATRAEIPKQELGGRANPTYFGYLISHYIRKLITYPDIAKKV